MSPPPSTVPPLSRRRSAQRVAALSLFLLSSAAFAAGGSMGAGLIAYAQPIILFLGVCAVIVGLVGSIFNAALLRGAVFAVVILVVIFAVLRNTAALQSAVQAG